MTPAGLLALCFASPAMSKELAPGYSNPPPVWVKPVADGETPLLEMQRYAPFPNMPEPLKPSLPPPDDVLAHAAALRLSCADWKVGPTPAFETEAHICGLLAGHDFAYAEGAVAGSWMTAAVIGGTWLVLRLPDWLISLLALVRRRRATP
jgi:hypothetical protein